jgi:hypothetical protein
MALLASLLLVFFGNQKLHYDWDLGMLPSGKRLHNYGKSPFSMGKSTINGHVQELC